MMRRMRRFIALFTAAMLLFVSTVPAVATATPCNVTTHAHHSAVARAAHRHMAMQARHRSWSGCIICGCGCHRSIDTLPHLLAPHAVGNPPFDPGIASQRTAAIPEPVLLATALRIPLPPPQSA